MFGASQEKAATVQAPHTDLAHYLVVLQNAPGYVDAVIVPIRSGHLLVDIGIDARHAAGGLARRALPTRIGIAGEGDEYLK